MNTFTPMLALVRKDLKLYFSNRRALIITVAAPIAIAAFFGSVMGGSGNKAPSKVPVAVVDQDGSKISQAIAAGLSADSMLAVQAMDETAARELVQKGKLRAAVVLPKNFGDDARRAMFQPASKPAIAVLHDPSQQMVLPMVQGLLAQHVMKNVMQSAFSTETLAGFKGEIAADANMAAADKQNLIALFDSVERVQKSAPASSQGGPAGMPTMDAPFTTKTQAVTSGRDTKYNGYSHSFAGMTVQFLLFMGIDIGVALLLSRRLGMWKRLRAAPLTRGQLLGSTVISSALIAVIIMTMIFAVGIAFFGVRVEGSWPGFIGVVLCFAMLTSSFGLLLAAIGNNPEATRGLAIFATLILVMLGGAWVPSFIFPEWLQTFSLAVPTRWAIDGMAAMTWRGLGFESAIAPMAVLLGASVVMFAVALWRFRWEE